MKGIDQLINRGHGIPLCHLGQVSIASRGGGTGVAEQPLNVAQTQTIFKQMGGKTVAQGMD